MRKAAYYIWYDCKHHILKHAIKLSPFGRAGVGVRFLCDVSQCLACCLLREGRSLGGRHDVLFCHFFGEGLDV